MGIVQSYCSICCGCIGSSVEQTDVIFAVSLNHYPLSHLCTVSVLFMKIKSFLDGYWEYLQVTKAIGVFYALLVCVNKFILLWEYCLGKGR